MKSFRGIRVQSLRRLMAWVVAMPLFVLAGYGISVTGQGFAEAKTIVEIDIVNKQYQLPPTTPIIPPGFSDPSAYYSSNKGVKWARMALRDGDTLKICNKDKFVMEPFSLNKGFTNLKAPGGQLHPGGCMTYVVHDNGKDPVSFYLFDELHAQNKTYLVVLPKGWPNQGTEKTRPLPKTNENLTEEYSLTAPPEVTSCSKDEMAVFSKLEGSWKSPNLHLFISGSCDRAGGTMDWREYCSSFDDPNNKDRTYPGTFHARMVGAGLSIEWSLPGQGVHKDQTGTATASPSGNGTLSVSGFGCGGTLTR